MKKYIYIICSLALTFTACDPMEDVYDELDALDKVSDHTMAITLGADDYKIATKNAYFLSEEDAAAKIPAILDSKYPHLDNGTVATVTYNTATTVFTNTYVSSVEEYEVTDEEYTALGFKYGNFDSADDMVTFLKHKYPEAKDKQLVKLTYAWYNGSTDPSTQDVTNHFFLVNGEWVQTYLVTNANYESVNHTKYTFSSSDGDNLALYLDKFLKESVLGAKAGDVQYVSYAYYSSSSKTTSQRVTAMGYNGSNWYELDESVTTEAALNFSKQDGVWVPDLSIRYTLVGADYLWISEQPVGDAAALASLGRYSNFDTSLWPRADLIKALGALLKNKYPNAEAGQKFKVTYIVYAGGTSSAEITLILDEAGEFEEAE
ncbi:hypothetical protein [uncultured Pontibacter sp.]|uniref:hypothetical protein n=1 Tax=uncultured Pontibacter sp. TaxID=453356 RepID=UPI00260C0C39|nr:hypothetical protein [uncultured Pontibacter sp.]